MDKNRPPNRLFRTTSWGAEEDRYRIHSQDRRIDVFRGYRMRMSKIMGNFPGGVLKNHQEPIDKHKTHDNGKSLLPLGSQKKSPPSGGPRGGKARLTFSHTSHGILNHPEASQAPLGYSAFFWATITSQDSSAWVSTREKPVSRSLASTMGPFSSRIPERITIESAWTT